ncbi:MAG: DUF2264 domain-containing protein, partial [Bacteroidota bacterium]
IQTPEGHWSMSLLSQDVYPTPETSGTSFFTFGLAWGVNHGLLDRTTYEPHIKRAWKALVGHISEEGKLGYVQHIGAGPDKSFKDQTEVYVTGAFLAAGSEVYTLFGGNPIFQIEKPDFKKSPKTGLTREHWKQAGMHLLEGAFSYVKTMDDPLKFPKIGKVAYPRYDAQIPTEKLEGLCRTLFVAAPLLKENPQLKVNGIKLLDYYRHNILNLIDKKHPSFIKDKQGNWPGQNLVEFGALAISFFAIPELLWDPLTQQQKDVLARKMISYADGPTVPSNWRFFNIMVLSFFKDQGYEVNEKLLVEYLEKSLADYREDGWYNDNPAFDYYSMWGYQMYAIYWSKVFGDKYYPAITKKLKANFRPVSDNYPLMFAKNGEMVMWGRSISYRYASASPLAFHGFYPKEFVGVNWGWVRRISSQVLLQFTQHPQFMHEKVPTLGFYGNFDPAVQPYSCRGSVFWGGKFFLALLIPADNPFWTATENDGAWEKELAKETVYNHFYPKSEVMVTNYPNIGASEIRAWCKVPVKGVKEPFRASENYNKLSYNTAFPWQADAPDGVVSMNYRWHTGIDSIGYEPGRLYDFQKYENGVYYRNLQSEWVEGLSFQLADIPLKNGMLRVDQVQAKAAISLNLGHYALPHIQDEITKKQVVIAGKEVHIIDNGVYQLATIPVYGWDKIVTHTKAGLHPVTDKSSVTNVSTALTTNSQTILATALLWKKSGERFTTEDLDFSGNVQVNEKMKQVVFKNEANGERVIRF